MSSEVPPFEVDHDGAEYVYAAVADHIQARILAGDLKVGQRLPAERDLAEEYGVAYMTVRRASRELRKRGLIRTVMGRGTCVAPPEQWQVAGA